MANYRLFPRGPRGCILGVANLSLAICLTVGTVNYQRLSHLFCGGRLSAGFPVAFVCDASGESPVSSWGKIDWADVDSINLPGSFVDILFYMMLLRITWLVVRRISHMVGRLYLGCRQ